MNKKGPKRGEKGAKKGPKRGQKGAAVIPAHKALHAEIAWLLGRVHRLQTASTCLACSLPAPQPPSESLLQLPSPTARALQKCQTTHVQAHEVGG